MLIGGVVVAALCVVLVMLHYRRHKARARPAQADSAVHQNS